MLSKNKSRHSCANTGNGGVASSSGYYIKLFLIIEQKGDFVNYIVEKSPPEGRWTA